MNQLINEVDQYQKKKTNNEFNYHFYIKTYPDIVQSGFNTYNKALTHWESFGKFEGRVCNRDMMNIKLRNNIHKNIQEINKYVTFPNIDIPTVNILVRTHSRPELFNICLDSIYKQNIDCRIMVSFDNIEDLNYISEHPDIEINYLSLNSSTNKYSFNSYCNYLLSFVSDGWVFFLDDDDMFLHPNSLNIIFSNIETEYDIIIWKFLRPDGEIYPKDLNNIKKGEICSCNFCFHSKFRKLASWPPKQFGDFHFFKELTSKFDFNIKYVPITLTTNIEHTKIGNFGK